MNRDTLFAELDAYLEVGRFSDYCPNGLQVEGRQEVLKVATGVSVSLDLIERALAWGADALITHHGIFWKGDPMVLKGFRRTRLKAVLEADLNVAGYHLPLDGHMEVGNNAVMARALGIAEPQPFAESGGTPIGVSGTLAEPVSAEEIVGRIASLCGGDPLRFLNGPAMVESLGIVSGGAGRMVEEAIAAGLDLYLTGEAQEPTMAIAAEAGIHVVAAGHWRTETFGIRALGERVAREYGLDVRFFELTNPV